MNDFEWVKSLIEGLDAVIRGVHETGTTFRQFCGRFLGVLAILTALGTSIAMACGVSFGTFGLVAIGVTILVLLGASIGCFIFDR